ncbi:nitroreductase family protein [Microbacterium sp. A196]|uniref:nitroreductase family protein n=1 Tax=Microbacterium sp. A196 TaxID=3457320 RepID=UPI003FD3424E
MAQRVAPSAPYVERARVARDALDRWNSNGTSDDQVAPMISAVSSSGISDPIHHLFVTRRSVRTFEATPVDPAQVTEAIRLALNTPSVCNRAPWNVRIFSGTEATDILRHQNGNRGFGHQIPAVLLVTVNVGLMTGTGERNQAWIEGGIFSSTLVWALHSMDIATCLLNLSLETDRANELRVNAALDDSDVPIAMIAIGHATPTARVAASTRRRLADVLR